MSYEVCDSEGRTYGVYVSPEVAQQAASGASNAYPWRRITVKPTGIREIENQMVNVAAVMFTHGEAAAKHYRETGELPDA